MDSIEAQDPFLDSDNEYKKLRQDRQKFRRSRFSGKNGGWTFRLTRNNCRRSLSQYEDQLRQAFESRKKLATFLQNAIDFASKEWDLVQVLLDNWGMSRHAPFFHRRSDSRLERLRNMQQLHHFTATLITEQLHAVVQQQAKLEQVPGFENTFRSWADSFFQSPEELFAQDTVVHDLREMIHATNHRLAEMDSVAATVRQDLLPRSRKIRAQELLKIAERARQWSASEAELQKMFKTLLVDTRTMHGQVMEVLIKDLLNDEKRDSHQIYAMIDAYTDQLLRFIDDAMSSPPTTKPNKSDRTFFGSSLLANLSSQANKKPGGSEQTDSRSISAQTMEMRSTFKSLVEGLVFPFLYQRMSAKREGQLDEEWRHIFVDVVHGFAFADFAPSVDGVFKLAQRSAFAQPRDEDPNVAGSQAGSKPLAKAVQQLRSMFSDQKVPNLMGQTFALLSQTIVNDIKSAWLAAKSRCKENPELIEEASATGFPMDTPTFPGITQSEYNAVLGYCFAQAHVRSFRPILGPLSCICLQVKFEMYVLSCCSMSGAPREPHH